MTWENSYYRRSKISKTKFRQVVHLFAINLTATDKAVLTGLSMLSTT